MKISKMLTILLFTITSALIAQDRMMYVHVINVGQGSAMLLEFPCGVVLVDTGGETNELFQSTDALMNYLEDFFIRRSDLNSTIDLVIISHPHIDHTRGAKEVAAKYRIKNIITNSETKKGSGISGQQHLQRLASQAEATESDDDNIGFFASSIDKISGNGITSAVIDPINCSNGDPIIKVLWGTSLTNPGWPSTAFDNQNNHSVVCKVEFGLASILLTGDLEDIAIHSLLNKYSDKSVFDSDVYLVGHHGSKNGTTLPLLQAVTPEIAILSFGDKSRDLAWTAWMYGHPNKNIVQLLEGNVSGTRMSKDVFLGTASKTFTHKIVSKAIYGTGWDDTFVLTGSMDGTWTYGMITGGSVVDTRININSATEAELQTLPSIGAVRAKAIVDYRITNPFDSVDELSSVKGIGPATINILRPLIKL